MGERAGPLPLDEDDDLRAFKPAQVAERLNCDVDTVYNLVKRGKLRRVLIGGHMRIPASALRAFLDGRPEGEPR